MKKELRLFIIAMGIVGLIATATADDLLVGREFEIKGEGVIFTELYLDTYYPGLKLGEVLSTPGGGYSGFSTVHYSSSFDVSMYNITTNAISDLGYKSHGRTTNVKRTLFSSNYIIGSIMRFKTVGNTEQNTEIFTDNGGMGADFSGKISGELKLSNKVVERNNYHNIIVSDVVDIEGNYTYDWIAYDILEEELELEWLGCP